MHTTHKLPQFQISMVNTANPNSCPFWWAIQEQTESHLMARARNHLAKGPVCQFLPSLSSVRERKEKISPDQFHFGIPKLATIPLNWGKPWTIQQTSHWLGDAILVTSHWFGDAIQQSSHWLGDAILVTSHWLGDAILVTSHWLGDAILVTSHWLGDAIHVRQHDLLFYTQWLIQVAHGKAFFIFRRSWLHSVAARRNLRITLWQLWKLLTSLISRKDPIMSLNWETWLLR